MVKNKTRKALIAVLAFICAVCLSLATFSAGGITVFAAHSHSGDTALTSSYLKTLEDYDADEDCNYYDLPSGNYYLTSDVNISYTIRIQNGASVSLCLNGYTLAFVGSSQYRYPVIEVIGSETYVENSTVVASVTKSSLTITDCSSSGKGTIDGNDCSGSVIKSYLADITIESGNITGGRGTIVFDPYDNNAKRDATQVEYKGTMSADDLDSTWDDGSDDVTYVGYAYGDESFYLQGGGIYALDTNLTITGGVIYGNGTVTSSATYNGETVVQYLRWDGSAGWGGDGYKMTESEATAAGYTVSDANGIYVDGDGYVYRTFSKGDQADFQRLQGGGIFIGTSYEWSGVCVANNSLNTYRSTFVMSGGSISNNACGVHGAGMFVHNVDFTMKGGVIGGSTQYLSAYTADGFNIEFVNGGNTAVQTISSVSGVDGGGIYVYRGAARGKGNIINITGTAEISYNKSKTNSAFTIGEGSNVSISGNITVAHNHSTSGGTASVSRSDFSMTGGVFEYNTTDSGQAGLSVGISKSDYDDSINEVYGTYEISIKNCYFRYNESGTLGDASTNGAVGNGPLSVSIGTDFSNVVTIQGVTVTGNTFTGNNSMALTGGKLTVKDCTVTNNSATGRYNNGATTASNYAGIYISRPITLTFTDCTIKGNSATGSGAVYIQGANAGANTVYTISNIVIDSNPVTGTYTASTDTYKTATGGALTIANGTSGTSTSVYNISNVTITNNEQYGTYGGMYVANSTYGTVITMTDCNISNNTCTSNGGGIWFGYNVTATLTDCDIVGNSANGSGGGIFANSASALNSSSALTLTDCSITNNQAGLTAAGNGGGMYLGYGVTATMTDCTVTGNSVGIQGELNSDGDAVETRGYAGNGGGIYLTAANVGSATNNAKAGASLIGKGLTVSGNTATSFGGGIFVGKGVIVTTSNFITSFATVVSGASVVLSASNNGKSNITGNSVIGYYNGTTATNLHSDAYGGGVYVEKGYTATAKDSVSGNTYNYYTGHSGSFTMTGGSISGNTSLNSGGGIYTGGSVTLTSVNVNYNNATGMYENYYISGSNVGKGLAAQGGGIYATTTSSGYMTTTTGSAYATLTLSNCSVSGNTSNGNGAGMSLNGYGLAVVISDTTINNNTIYEKGIMNSTTSTETKSYSYGSGGGLYLSSIRSISISGSDISYNTAPNNGGGIYITTGTVAKNETANTNLSDDENTYTWSASVYATTVTITGTTVTNNIVTGYTANSGVTDGTLTNGNGGGIYLENYYTFSMTGGSISSNTAITGGGLYMKAKLDTSYGWNANDSAVTLAGVSVSKNYAKGYYKNNSDSINGGQGGGIYIANSTALPVLTLTTNESTATTVTGNAAGNNGGGIYMGGGSTSGNGVVVKLESSEVTGNYTYNSKAGAGIYANGTTSQLIVSGTAKVSDNVYLTTSKSNTEGNASTSGTASNVYLNGTSTYVYIAEGGLSSGAAIYITSSDTSSTASTYIAIVRSVSESVELTSYTSYFFSDVSNYKFVYDSDGTYSHQYCIVRIYSSGETSDATTTVDTSTDTGADTSSTTTVSEAFNLTITLKGENATITGTTSGYYAEHSELENGTVEFKIIIDDGYYFNTITIDGVTYSFTNSTSNLTNDGATPEVGLVSSVTITAYTGYIIVKITYADDISTMVNDGTLAYSVSVTAAEVGDAFYVGYVDGASVSATATSFTTTYDGAAKAVTVYKTTDNSEVSIYILSFTVQYLVDGEWGETAPTAIGTYSIRVQWTQTGYVGGTTYGGTIWTMNIVAQEWSDDSHEYVTATLSTYTYDYAIDESFTPEVTVTDSVIGVLTVENDYVVTYSGNSGAGIGIVTITGIGNYTGSFTVSYTINRVETFTATNNITSSEKTYDGSAYTITLGTYTVASNYSGTINYTITRSDGSSLSSNEYITENNGTYSFSYLNAGEYIIVIYIDGDANYLDGEYTINVTINKGASTVSVDNVVNTAATYNGANQEYLLTSATATTGGADVSNNITYTIYSSTADGVYISNGTLYVKNVGTYVVAFAVAEQDNYSGATEYVTFTVNKMSLTVPAYTGSNSFAYDGESHTLNINTYSAAYISVNANAQTEVGTYYVTISLIDTDNTQWSDGTTGNKTHAYSITKSSNTITSDAKASYTYTYNGRAQGLNEVEVASAFASEHMAYEASTGISASYNNNLLTFSVTDAGTYTITFTSLGGSNYTEDTYTITITVYTAVNTITTSGVKTEYEYTYNGNANTVSGTVASAFDNANMECVATTGVTIDYKDGALTFSVTDAGNYTITFTSQGNDNYSSETYSISIVVNSVVNTITTSGVKTEYEYTYNGNANTVSGTVSSAFDNANMECVATTGVTIDYENGALTFSVTDAGNYTITFTSQGNDNYSSETYSIAIVVNSVVNTITTSGVKTEYEYTYNGNENTVSGTVSSAFDNANMECVATTGVTIDYENGALTFSVTDAGNYTITFTSHGNDNYSSETYSISIVVYSVENTLTASSSTTEYRYIYIGSAQNISLGMITAAQGGNIATYVTLNGSASTIAVNESASGYSVSLTNVGTYVITFTSASSVNFSSDSISITITIEKAANGITVGNIPTTYTYSGSQSIDINSVVASFGTIEVSVSNGGTYSDGKVWVENSGNYTITFTVAETDNYDGATATLSVVVNPYTLDKPIATGASYVYTGAAQTFAFTSDENSEYYTVSGGERTNAGTYYVYVTLKDTSNYSWADGTVNTLSYTFTIAKATPSYTVPTGLSYTAGTVLSTITLPSGWSWADATAKVSSDVSSYSAVYTPSDTDNYTTVTAEITIGVITATISTGISSDVNGEVSASSGFTETITLNVNIVESGDYDAEESDIVDTVVSQTTLENATVVSVYEINLTTASGSEITVSAATDDSSITVTVAIPSDVIGKDFYIVHIHDGNIIDTLDSSDYTVSNGYVTFTVDQLSQFAFVVEAATDVAENTVLIFLCIDAVLIVAAVVLLAVNNRRKRKAKAL